MIRTKELILLLGVWICLAAGFTVISNQGAILALLSVAPFFIASLALSFFLPDSSQVLLPVCALIAGLGFLNMLQINEKFFTHQLYISLIGLIFFILTLVLLSFFKRIDEYRYIFGIIALFLFLMPMFSGVIRGGSKLWVNLGPITFQPSEFAKIFFFLFIAGYFAEHRMLLSRAVDSSNALFEFRYLGPALVIAGFALLTLVILRDLGFSLLILSTFLIGLYVSTGRKRYPIGGLVIFILGAIGAYYFFPHVKARIEIWINPFQDVYGRSYQIVQSLFAFAEGGIIGKGLGKGFPQLLPAAHTDMVFPVWTESTGLVGGILVLSLYFLFSMTGLIIARSTESEFGKILVSVASLSLFIQAAIVAGGTLRAFPLTGLTMPFFSYGGSSFVSSFVVLALIMKYGSEKKKWIVL